MPVMSVQKQVTIRQVAQQAGVSTQTVSRVLNDRPDVAPETRQRVQDVIERLGYTPSAIARSLIRRRSHSLGVVVAELGQYGPMRRLVGIEQAANELGYSLHLSLARTPEDVDNNQILEELLSWHVDGIVWAVAEVGDDRHWREHINSQLPVPIVFISEQIPNFGPTISIDNRTGGQLATQHLLEQGYRHIGLITGPSDWVSSWERQLGWQDVLKQYEQRQIFEGDWSAASGERGLCRLLETFPEMDAVFACNDQMALGVLRAAVQLNLNVPRNLGVIGYDNIPEANYYFPPLSTVKHRLSEQGRLAVHQVVKIIEARQRSEPVLPLDITILKPQLVIRKSSVIS